MNKKISLLILLACVLNMTAVMAKNTNEATKWKGDAQQRRFDYYFYEAVRLKNQQQYDQALEVFRFCEQLNPNDAGVQSELGMLYGAVGLKELALESFEKSVQLQPTNWWFNIRLISVYTESNNLTKALTLVNKLQKLYPNKEDVYQLEASLYKGVNEFTKSIAAFDKLENLVGVNEAISNEKIQLYLLAHKPQKAIEEIDRLIAKYPTESRYKVLRGDFFMQQQKPDLALQAYEKVLAEDAGNGYVYISLSDYYKTTNQPEKALDAIVKALKNDNLEVETKMEVLGQYVEKLVHDTTKLDETESLFRLLVERYPLEEMVHSYYAQFLMFRNRRAETASELETMLTINPKNEQTWLRLIQATIQDRNYQQLLTLTQRSIDVLPKVPTWYLYKGLALYQLNEHRKALEAYQAGLPFCEGERAAAKEDLYAQIADTYYKLGNRDSAFVAYETVLSLNPRNVMAMNNYAYYLSLEKKDLKKAEHMSAKTVELEPKNSTYLDTYAWILYEQGSYSLARFYIEKAVDNLPKDEDQSVVLEHYGDILWMSGAEYDAKAMEMWQKSYDSGNKTPELKKKIENKGWKR